MKDKTLMIIIAALFVFLIIDIVTVHPFEKINEHTSTAQMTYTSYYIAALTGQATSVSLIITVNAQESFTNGEILIATINYPLVTYTMYFYNQNTYSKTVLTISTNQIPDVLRVTYNKGYLTYNSMRYYTDVHAPYTFSDVSTTIISNTVIMKYEKGVISMKESTTIYG